MTSCHLTSFRGMNSKPPFIHNKTQMGLEGGKEISQQCFRAQPRFPFQGHADRSSNRLLSGKCPSAVGVARSPQRAHGDQPPAVRSELTSCSDNSACPKPAFWGFARGQMCAALRLEIFPRCLERCRPREAWPSQKGHPLKTQQLAFSLAGSRHWTASPS